MNSNLNALIEHYAAALFRVQGVYHYRIEPGKTSSHLSSPFPGFVFPLAGRAQLQFNGTPYLMEPGAVLHGGAKMRMDNRVVGDLHWEYLCVLYAVIQEPEGLRLSKQHFQLVTGPSLRLTELLWQLWESANQPGAMETFRADTLFRTVLEEIFLYARSQGGNDTQELFEQVTAYIHRHYMESLSVRELAERHSVNENRLFYVFQKYAGMGAGDYLLAYRLNRAQELLITTELPVGQIAQSVGYPDALYFSRMFKQRFRVSPSQLRGR